MEINKKMEDKDLSFEQKLDYEKLKVEKLKAKFEILKWFMLTVGAVTSFYIIDVGKLNIEKFSAESANHEKLLNAYLSTTDSPNPDLWKRKLKLIRYFTKDSTISVWADKELKHINEKAALLSLYKETLGVVSIISNRQIYGTTEWLNASKRFYQLYWADLPFYGESRDVESDMVNFKEQLDKIHNNKETGKWEDVDQALFELSNTFKKEVKALEHE